MCDIVFEKATGRGGKVNRTRVYAEPKGFFKKCVMMNFAEFTRNHLCWNIVFDKVKLCRSATSLKTSL